MTISNKILIKVHFGSLKQLPRVNFFWESSIHLNTVELLVCSDYTTGILPLMCSSPQKDLQISSLKSCHVYQLYIIQPYIHCVHRHQQMWKITRLQHITFQVFMTQQALIQSANNVAYITLFLWLYLNLLQHAPDSASQPMFSCGQRLFCCCFF